MYKVGTVGGTLDYNYYLKNFWPNQDTDYHFNG